MAMGQEVKPDCRVVIGACDKALASKNKALTLSDLAVKECQKQNSGLHEKNIELIDDSSRWYRNPVIMFVFGAAAGSLTYVLLKK